MPHYEQRLRSLHYKKKFAASIAELTPRMRAVLEASRQVARSRRLRKLLELVLALGNYVNRGNARGNACGFRLASLNRLVDTKSSCSKGTTLLHYLVQILESRFREVLDIEEDMPHVRTAARVSMADLQKEVANLKNGLQDVQREIGKPFTRFSRFSRSMELNYDCLPSLSPASSQNSIVASLRCFKEICSYRR